jgi:hypothetical protein
VTARKEPERKKNLMALNDEQELATALVLEISREAAVLAAALYAQFLSVPVPVNEHAIVNFTGDQAFELVKAVLCSAFQGRDAQIP